jgi:hypothetical protein
MADTPTMKGRARALAWAALAAVALAPAALAQALYKWTDEKGNVHYTDKAPETPGGTVLDKQGREVRKIEPPPTPEQLRAREAEEERLRAAVKEQESAARRDRALLSSYTMESEIDLAKARAAATLESQIQSAQAYLAQLTKRKQELDARKARFGDKPIPTQLEHDSAVIDSEYAKNSDLVAQKRRELAQMVARYDADKQRWRELKAIESANSAAQAANRPPAPVAGSKK